MQRGTLQASHRKFVRDSSPRMRLQRIQRRRLAVQTGKCCGTSGSRIGDGNDGLMWVGAEFGGVETGAVGGVTGIDQDQGQEWWNDILNWLKIKIYFYFEINISRYNLIYGQYMPIPCMGDYANDQTKCHSRDTLTGSDLLAGNQKYILCWLPWGPWFVRWSSRNQTATGRARQRRRVGSDLMNVNRFNECK